MAKLRHTARAISAFLAAQTRSRLLGDRAAIARYQARQLQRFTSHARHNVATFQGIPPGGLETFPEMGKAELMAQFASYNTLGLSSERAWRVYEGVEPLPGYHVGCSTGTSGNRGLYVVSDAERFTWLGTILGKALPDVWRRRMRVAIILPGNSQLYDAANESRALTLRFFDLRKGLESLPRAVEAFAPDIIVAPPKTLVALSEAEITLAPRKLYSAAEVLDPLDRAIVEARFGVTLGQIYMATEGLFAVSCPHGTLHLAEDVVHFELEPHADDPALVSPIITDFTRRTQVMVRYRMNDLLRLADHPCPCGSAFTTVAQVIGRADDCFVFPTSIGQPVTITPDIIRNAVVDADRAIADFRVIQTGANAVKLLLPCGPPERLDKAREALSLQFRRLGAAPEIQACMTELTPPTEQKLRRIERRSRVFQAA